ncbi:hypothetical protein C9374_013520 [Naegleria lovaniensis]|uniref:Uncharacterized protein n=1 Tax=Naegleria lovaniensis TaxID=51637 RepID=A0AA88KVQ3_NAELO|nr:uncharacterized protein C9374_013520 [Naegleria lovaniensis]KAG2392035.1 hypothetical protein C9374_013520 [Naegleria lovaniensis]
MSSSPSNNLLQSVLVTGASRGIGLEFVKQLLNNKSSTQLVYATCRDPSQAKQLNELQQQHKDRLVIDQLDITSDDSINALVSRISNKSLKFTLLFNNAGITIQVGDSISESTRDNMVKIFETNTVGPVLLSQKVYNNHLLEKGALIVNISSILGSIELATQPYYPNYTGYTISKAALNMVTRLQSTAWKDVYALSIHPGWLKTDMGGEEAPESVSNGVSGIINVIEKFNPETQNGAFIQYNGQPLACHYQHSDLLSLACRLKNIEEEENVTTANSMSRTTTYPRPHDDDDRMMDEDEEMELDVPTHVLFEKGFTSLYAKGMFTEAAKYFDRILRRFPDHVEALYHKGVTHYVSADFSETIKLENRVLQLDPRHRWAYVIKGNAYNERGEYKKALETFQECIKITNDTFDVVYNAMGNCFFLQEDFQGSLATYNKSISLALNTFTLSNIHPDDVIFRILENDQNLSQICQNVLSQRANAHDGSIPYVAPDFSKLQLSPVEERFKTRIYERVYLMKYTTACLTILNKGLTLVCMNRFMEALDCFLLIVQVSHSLMGKSIFKVGKRLDPTRMSELIELLNNEDYMIAKNNGSLAYDSRTSHCIAYCGIGIICEALTSNLYSNECGMGCPCSNDHDSSVATNKALTSSSSSSDIAADAKHQQHSHVSHHSGDFCRGSFKDMLSFNKKNDCYSMADLFFERADRLIEDTRMRREVLYFKGEGLRNIRDYNRSIEYFQKGLEMNPLEIRSMIGVGRVSINLQDLKTARQIFNKILDITDYDHPIAMKYLQVVKMSPHARNEKANIYCDITFQCQH